MSYRLLIAPIALGLLAGCNTVKPEVGAPDPAFGEAAKYNAAVQVINPDPVYAEDASQPGYHGAKGAEAVKRYRTDRVKEVEVMQTTGSTGGGSGPR